MGCRGLASPGSHASWRAGAGPGGQRLLVLGLCRGSSREFPGRRGKGGSGSCRCRQHPLALLSWGAGFGGPGERQGHLLPGGAGSGGARQRPILRGTWGWRREGLPSPPPTLRKESEPRALKNSPGLPEGARRGKAEAEPGPGWGLASPGMEGGCGGSGKCLGVQGNGGVQIESETAHVPELILLSIGPRCWQRKWAGQESRVGEGARRRQAGLRWRPGCRQERRTRPGLTERCPEERPLRPTLETKSSKS